MSYMIHGLDVAGGGGKRKQNQAQGLSKALISKHRNTRNLMHLFAHPADNLSSKQPVMIYLVSSSSKLLEEIERRKFIGRR